MTDSLWIEKYRPIKFDDMVLPEEYKNVFTEWLDKKNIPHLLLYGPQGSGKTTLARILISNIIDNKDDVLILNGSTYNGVDTVRDHIVDFVRTPSFSKCNYKIVFIDEADYLSQNAQAALRGILEEYYKNCRFIFTCNYKNKIIDPLISRCQSFKFDKLPNSYVENYLKNILESEDIKYTDGVIKTLIDSYSPDVRRIVGILQSSVCNGEINNSDVMSSSIEKTIQSYINDMITYIINNNYEKAMAIVKVIQSSITDEVDYPRVYVELFNSENIPFWVKVIINEYSIKHSNSMIPTMNFCAMCYGIIKAAREIHKLGVRL